MFKLKFSVELLWNNLYREKRYANKFEFNWINHNFNKHAVCCHIWSKLSYFCADFHSHAVKITHSSKKVSHNLPKLNYLWKQFYE